MREQTLFADRTFDLATAMRWWKNDNNECKPGHFNLKLYLAYLRAKYEE